MVELIFQLIEGGIGALLMILSFTLGLFFIVRGTMFNRKYAAPASACLTAAVAIFMLRATVGLFFGEYNGADVSQVGFSSSSDSKPEYANDRRDSRRGPDNEPSPSKDTEYHAIVSAFQEDLKSIKKPSSGKQRAIDQRVIDQMVKNSEAHNETAEAIFKSMLTKMQHENTRLEMIEKEGEEEPAAKRSVGKGEAIAFNLDRGKKANGKPGNYDRQGQATIGGMQDFDQYAGNQKFILGGDAVDVSGSVASRREAEQKKELQLAQTALNGAAFYRNPKPPGKSRNSKPS